MILLTDEAKRRMLLQIFAGDGGGSGSGDGGGTGGEGGSGGEPAGGSGSDEPMSFEDFLKREGNQAEFDRRVNKAVETAVTKVEEKWKALTDDKLTEAEKLAKMTKAEQIEYKNKKLEKELETLKREKEASELAAEARKTLAGEKITIPDELLTNLIGKDAAQTEANVESFSKLYKNAIQEGVKEALKGEPPKGGKGGTPVTKEQIFKIEDPIERQRMIAENIELFQN